MTETHLTGPRLSNKLMKISGDMVVTQDTGRKSECSKFAGVQLMTFQYLAIKVLLVGCSTAELHVQYDIHEGDLRPLN